MSDFVRNALQGELEKMRRDIRAHGFDVQADGSELRIVEIAAPAAAVLQLTAPATTESTEDTEEGGKAKNRRKPKLTEKEKADAHRKANDVLTGKRACSEPGCTEPHMARGMCKRHYANWRYAEKLKAKKA